MHAEDFALDPRLRGDERSSLPHNRIHPDMLDRTDLEPVFFAPFVSSLMHVEPQWIDYNGHLNMAYYNVLFDRAVDEVYELSASGSTISSSTIIRPSPPKSTCATCASCMKTIRCA